MEIRPYKCTKCGEGGIKLWREYQTFANDTELLCASCLNVLSADDKGKILGKYNDLTDQIAPWMVPAVAVEPYEKSGTFWGYTSVPQKDVEKWWALPTYSKK